MNNAIFSFSCPKNEPVKEYRPNSPERIELDKELARLSSGTIEIPLIIGGKEVRTGNTGKVVMPHNHKHVLATYHIAGEKEIKMAIDAALAARREWEQMPWVERASIAMRIAELLATKYRALINASTMLGQSKNAFQAEIDAACEAIDFFRFNAYYMGQIYSDQPLSSPGCINRVEYRPLEGFIFAVSPFNFTSIASNLAMSPALMGNVVVWKPATTSIFSNYFLMKIYKEAGLPDGVINFIPSKGSVVGKEVFSHPMFAGAHFTGSTSTFNQFFKMSAQNQENYRTYPKLVGETGGKDFVFVHPSASYLEVAVALVRGAFEFQGQKCSAASRAYLPKSMWEDVKREMGRMLAEIKMGDVTDYTNFVNAVIDEASFDTIAGYIEKAKGTKDAEIVFGGKCDKSVGYFIQPTVILAHDPKFITMCEEIFGPVLTIYVYEDAKFVETLELCDQTSPYALTGSIFSNDRAMVSLAMDKLRYCAGNFYINDKPTGAVVGQQPFGGARASGTNDKAGSYLNLTRWVSPRAIKETLVPPTDYKYPFLAK